MTIDEFEAILELDEDDKTDEDKKLLGAVAKGRCPNGMSLLLPYSLCPSFAVVPVNLCFYLVLAY